MNFIIAEDLLLKNPFSISTEMPRDSFLQGRSSDVPLLDYLHACKQAGLCSFSTIRLEPTGLPCFSIEFDEQKIKKIKGKLFCEGKSVDMALLDYLKNAHDKTPDLQVILDCIHKTNFLTPRDFDYIYRFNENISERKKIVECLFERKLFTKELFGGMTAHPFPDALYQCVLALEELEILTPENLELIFNLINVDKVTMISWAYRSKFLTRSCWEILLEHQDVETLIKLIDMMVNVGRKEIADFLTEENFKIIIQHPQVSELHEVITYLRNKYLLTPEIFNMICYLPRIDIFHSKLLFLSDAKILHQDNLTVLLDPQNQWLLSLESSTVWSKLFILMTQEIFEELAALASQPDPQSTITDYMNDLIEKEREKIILQNTEFLTEENSEIIRQYPEIVLLGEAIDILHEKGLVTSEVFNKICHFPDIINFNDAIRLLSAAQILQQSNLDALLNPQNQWLLSEEAYPLIWDNHELSLLMTQEIFEEMTTLASQPDPRITIAALVEELIQKDKNTFNNSQSTHTASIHESSSDSALKLQKLYGRKYSEKKILKNMQRLFKNEAVALRAISRLCDPAEAHIDPVSKVSLKKLLTLTFFAINDDKAVKNWLLRENPCLAKKAKKIIAEEIKNIKKDALKRFKAGLLDILEKDNTGENKKDNPICPGGAFNKLIEALCGAHPDCHQEFITPQLAALKLFCVVQEVAFTHLLENEASVSEYKKTGIEAIWEAIKNEVSDRMFKEFSSIYNKDITDSKFVALIEAGIYLPEKVVETILQRVEEETQKRVGISEPLPVAEQADCALSSLSPFLLDAHSDFLDSDSESDSKEDNDVPLKRGVNISPKDSISRTLFHLKKPLVPVELLVTSNIDDESTNPSKRKWERSPPALPPKRARGEIFFAEREFSEFSRLPDVPESPCFKSPKFVYATPSKPSALPPMLGISSSPYGFMTPPRGHSAQPSSLPRMPEAASSPFKTPQKGRALFPSPQASALPPCPSPKRR